MLMDCMSIAAALIIFFKVDSEGNIRRWDYCSSDCPGGMYELRRYSVKRNACNTLVHCTTLIGSNV